MDSGWLGLLDYGLKIPWKEEAQQACGGGPAAKTLVAPDSKHNSGDLLTDGNG